MRDFRNESPALSAELIALRQDVQPTWHDAPWKAPTNENRDHETVVLPVYMPGNSGSVPCLLRHGNQWEGQSRIVRSPISTDSQTAVDPEQTVPLFPAIGTDRGDPDATMHSPAFRPVLHRC